MNPKEIVIKIEEIIEEFRRSSISFDGVNWKAVNVGEIYIKKTVYPEPEKDQVVVVLDECSPDAWEFRQAILQEYNSRFKGICKINEIRSEW